MTTIPMPEPVARVHVGNPVRHEHIDCWCLDAGTHDLITTSQAEAYADAMVKEAQQWISVDERLPDVGVPVLVYIPPGPDSHPGEVDIRFDFICPDYEYWHQHSEHYEHFLCVAKGGADCPMTGPSEKAPYSHWMPLPPPPTK